VSPPPEDTFTQLGSVVDWLPDSSRPLWELVNQSPLIGAFLIAFGFFLAAYLVRYFLLQNLEKLLVRTDTQLDNQVIQSLRRPVFTTILYFGLALAAEAAQLTLGKAFLIDVFLSIIVASWMRASLPLSTILLEALARNQHRFPVVEHHTVPLLDLSIRLFVILIGSYCLLMIWGINPLGWLASAGIVGIAVGFAAKDSLANLFSGFFILVDRPYKIGDYINLDTGERGRVTNIGLRSTRLLSRDDIEIIVPNAVIANAKIINESGGPYLNIRVRLPVGVAYGSDVDKVCEILQSIANEHAELGGDPSPRVRMRGFGPSSLNFELLGWIYNPEDRGRILHELYMTVYKAFRAEGIEIPYAKTDVYIKELPHSDTRE